MIVVEDRPSEAGEVMEQSQDERNAGILQAWMPKWVTNTFRNYPGISDDFQIEDMSVDVIPRVKSTPAIIIGSGPSLDRAAPLLAKWKGAVFASLTNMRACAAGGHIPEFMCAFDGGDTYWKYLEGEGFDWSSGTLLTHPAASPYLLEMWRAREWKRRYYIMMHLGNQWFDLVTPIVFGGYKRWPERKPVDIRIAIENAGCTANNEIQLANWLGYSPLFLCGCDFGYPNNVERATGYRWSGSEWIQVPSRSTDALRKERTMRVGDNGCPTTDEQIEYKQAMLSIWKLDAPHLIDCSGGLITELPKADIEEVIQNGGAGYEHLYRGKEEIGTIVDAILDRKARMVPAGADHRPDEAVRADGDGSGRPAEAAS